MIPELQPEVVKQIEAFQVWLLRHGAEVCPTAQWELIRWRPASGDGPHMIYTNKKGEVSKFNGSEAARTWAEFLSETYAAQRTVSPKAPVYTLPTRPNPEPAEAPSFGLAVSVGNYSVLRYTSSYIGADIHDKANNWVANIHGTTGRKAKEIPTYERNIWLFCHAEKMAQLLDELTSRGTAQADLPRLRHLGGEVQEFLKGLPK